MNITYKVIYDHHGRQKHFVTQSICVEGAEENFKASAYGAFPIVRVEVVPKRGARA